MPNNKFLISLVLVVAVAAAIGGYFFVKNRSETAKPGKIYHVGVLNGYDFFGETTDGFKDGMAELGYIENENIFYDEIKTDVDIKKYDDVVKKFVEDKVDLVLAYPTEASLEAKKVTAGTGIPVIFANANIEGVNLVNSISNPGDNITGVRYPGPDIAPKRLEILLEIAPDAKKIVVPYLKDYPNVPPQLESLHQIVSSLGITLIEAPVLSPRELQEFFDSQILSGAQIDAILAFAEPVSATPAFVEVYGKFAVDHKIPWGGALVLKKDGYAYESLFGISTDSSAVGRRAAKLADKIFKGIPAGTIPVVSAESFLELNYRAADEMGLKFSENLLNKAQNIIR